MQFETLQALWQMSGHGPFVWGAYAIALCTLAGIVWAPLARRRRFFAEQRGIERRRAARQTSAAEYAAVPVKTSADMRNESPEVS